jgi:hypothetical protein
MATLWQPDANFADLVGPWDGSCDAHPRDFDERTFEMQARYMEKRGLIERELVRCATAKPMERPTYTEFGVRVGIPKQGPWQPVLDAIANDADEAKEPDLTFLIRNARTGYPSRIGRLTTREPSDEQKRHAKKKMQEIINKYNPGTQNPF